MYNINYNDSFAGGVAWAAHKKEFDANFDGDLFSVFLSASYYGPKYFIVNMVKQKLLDMGLTAQVRQYGVGDAWIVARNKDGSNRMFIRIEGLSGSFILEDKHRSCTLYFHGAEQDVYSIFTWAKEEFPLLKFPHLSWYFMTKSGFDSVSMDVEAPEITPVREFYPWLDKEPEEYYKSFLNSRSNILLMLGSPGTGKTSFLRDMITKENLTVRLTYEEELFRSDAFFIDYLKSSEADLLVVEDADSILAPRDHGNSIMAKFLNVGDGLAASKKKKIIFTSNLTRMQLNQIDSALIRPGRCFDVLEFRELDRQEAQAVANVVGVELQGGKSEYTLAEIFNSKQTPKPNKFGFALQRPEKTVKIEQYSPQEPTWVTWDEVR